MLALFPVPRTAPPQQRTPCSNSTRAARPQLVRAAACMVWCSAPWATQTRYAPEQQMGQRGASSAARAAQRPHTPCGKQPHLRRRCAKRKSPSRRSCPNTRRATGATASLHCCGANGRLQADMRLQKVQQGAADQWVKQLHRMPLLVAWQVTHTDAHLCTSPAAQKKANTAARPRQPR